MQTNEKRKSRFKIGQTVEVRDWHGEYVGHGEVVLVHNKSEQCDVRVNGKVMPCISELRLK